LPGTSITSTRAGRIGGVVALGQAAHRLARAGLDLPVGEADHGGVIGGEFAARAKQHKRRHREVEREAGEEESAVAVLRSPWPKDARGRHGAAGEVLFEKPDAHIARMLGLQALVVAGGVVGAAEFPAQFGQLHELISMGGAAQAAEGLRRLEVVEGRGRVEVVEQGGAGQHAVQVAADPVGQIGGGE
jgi:hypothetical protein